MMVGLCEQNSNCTANPRSRFDALASKINNNEIGIDIPESKGTYESIREKGYSSFFA